MQDLNPISARRIALLVAALAAAFCLAQSAAAHTANAGRISQAATRGGAAAPRAASAATAIYVHDTPEGAVIGNKPGRVYFIFPKDKRTKNVCQEKPKCATDWPAVTTTGALKLGPGVKRSLVKLIPFKGKLKQVTYAGHPLHFYKFDEGPYISYTFIGIPQFGADWYGLTASGQIVHGSYHKKK